MNYLLKEYFGVFIVDSSDRKTYAVTSMQKRQVRDSGLCSGPKAHSFIFRPFRLFRVPSKGDI